MMVTIKEQVPLTRRKKRVSKKLKSSWRKHVDISDVDNFLAEQRLEERVGDYGKLSDKQLFTLDTNQSPVVTARKARREQLRNAPLKCLSLLQPLTKVPDPIAKRNRVRSKLERTSKLIKRKNATLKAKGIFKKTDLQRVANMHFEREKRDAVEGKFDFNKDIWHSEEKNTAPKTKDEQLNATLNKNEWLQGEVEKHITYTLGTLTKAMPKAIRKKPHCLNAIELPHPGMSYNPTYSDHQQLLQMVAEKEQKLIKEEEHLARVTTNMFRKVTPLQKDANWLIEMSEGLKPDCSNVDDSGMYEEYRAINPPVRNEEKSKKQRRKQKEQQQLREQLRKAKIERKKVSDMHRLKAIHVEIEGSERRARLRHEKRLKKAAYQKLEAKRLAAKKFEEPGLDFNRKHHIAGNLRNLHKEGNLLSARFKSLQKRNIIAPSDVRATRSKAKKVKKFVRPGHKEDTWKLGVAKQLS